MRRWMGAVVVGLALAAPAWAQRTVTFGGVDPLRVVNRPVDTNNSVVPIARPQTLAETRFSLSKILPRVGLPGARPVIGRSDFPTPQNMPGANFLNAFHFQRPQGVRP